MGKFWWSHIPENLIIIYYLFNTTGVRGALELLELLEFVPVESIGVESIGVVGVVGVRTPKKSAHNTLQLILK